jgi:hypothetical protein
MIRSLNRALSCLVLVALLLFPITSLGQGDRTPPETVVRNFYAWYLHKLYGQDYKKQKTTSLKYMTPKFYARAPKLEDEMTADIFVCAQDWDETWEHNFTIAQPAISGTSATTRVTLGSGADRMVIKVALKLTGAGWRIDGVQCAD